MKNTKIHIYEIVRKRAREWRNREERRRGGARDRGKEIKRERANERTSERETVRRRERERENERELKKETEKERKREREVPRKINNIRAIGPVVPIDSPGLTRRVGSPRYT